MGSLRDFAAKMQARASRFEANIHAEMAKLAINVVENVAMDTPIATGQAQSNWLTSIGVPILYYKANIGANSAAIESIDMAHTVLAGYAGGVIHVTNNVPYIAELNAGSSRQAPALFVQAALLRAQYNFRSLKITL